MKTHLVKALIAAFCAALVSAAPTTSPQAEEEINLAAGIALSYAPIYVADDQGFFAKHGLTAKVLPFPSGRTAQEAIVGGGVVWGTVAETPIVFAASNNLPVRVIATMSHYEIFDMVATKDIGKIEDMKGKRIGFAQGTNSQVYLARILEKAGLTQADITGINLSPTDMMTSIANGQIDAFIWAEPHLSQAIALGEGKFHAIHTPGIYVQYSGMVTLQDTIDKHPEMLVKSICAMKDATAYMKANKQAAIDLIAERIKMDKAIVAKEFDRVPFEMSLDKATLVKEMTREARWAVDSGLLPPGTEIPDFNTIVVTAPFEQAQDCAGK